MKSRLVGIIEIPEVPACGFSEPGLPDRADATLKQAFRRLAASPASNERRRSRLDPLVSSSSATVVYADLGQLCCELKAEASRLQGQFLD